jgi:hypothetical protein
MVQLGPKSYILVYTCIYFDEKICTRMYGDVQSEESIYLDVPRRVCTYHTRYMQVRQGIVRMASAHAIIGLIFPIIAIIVRFCVAAWLDIRAADHETMILRNRANLRSARAANGECIRAVLMSILAFLV